MKNWIKVFLTKIEQFQYERIQKRDKEIERLLSALAKSKAQEQTWKRLAAELMDATCLPKRSMIDHRWSSLCLLTGRYCEPYLSYFQNKDKAQS